MKRVVLMLILAVSALGMTAQNISEKTMVKPFRLGAESLEVHLDGVVEVKYWNNEYAQAEINVVLEGFNAQILKSLVTAGRYDLAIEKNGEITIISSPNLAKDVKLRGKEVKDEVKFTIFVPEGYPVHVSGDEGLSAINMD